MLIDAHQHCWQLQRPECRWPTPDLTPIYRDYGLTDFEAEAATAGVTASVLVQSQEDDRDTEYLMALADESPLVQGVVGWLDLKADSAPEQVAALARHPKMRGLRPMLQAQPDDAWILDPAVEPAIAAMTAHKLVFDALVLPRHLPYLRRFAESQPQLTVVIDHGAKPPIAEGQREPWREQMRALAARPNVYCKLSGLLTEAAAGQGLDDLRPWVDDLLDFFGPQRLLWGSDWPVINLAANYHRWLGMTLVLLRPLDLAAREAILAGTARSVYRLSV